MPKIECQKFFYSGLRGRSGGSKRYQEVRGEGGLGLKGMAVLEN